MIFKCAQITCITTSVVDCYQVRLFKSVRLVREREKGGNDIIYYCRTKVWTLEVWLITQQIYVSIIISLGCRHNKFLFCIIYPVKRSISSAQYLGGDVMILFYNQSTRRCM